MNIFDEFIAKIPVSEVTIKTSISSYAVIERLERGIMPSFIIRHRESSFSFEGSYSGNYFRLQGHFINSDGEDAFPNKTSVGIGFIRLPVRIETSPTFYGRVRDTDNGSIIKGHFGFPFPILSLFLVLILFIFAMFYPAINGVVLGFATFLLVWSVFSLPEFITERKGIMDFLKGLFSDVIKIK